MSDVEQHRIDNSYHNQGGPNHYTDEEWDTWYDRDDDPGKGVRSTPYDNGEPFCPKAPQLPIVPKKSAVED